MSEPLNCSPSELSIYLQALGEGFLPTSYSDTDPSAPSKLITIASKPWRKGKKMGTFPGFQFSMTSPPSTETRGEEKSMRSQADFPAKTLAARVKEPVLPGLEVDSGSLCSELLARLNQDGCSWKIARSLPGEAGPSLLPALPPWGMTVGGELFRLPMPSGLAEHRDSITSESVSSCVGRMPTLRASPGENRQTKISPSQANGLRGLNLATAVRLPTVLASEFNNRNKRCAKSTDGLQTVLKRLPTVTAQDCKNNGSASQQKRDNLNSTIGGALNPDWVEWFMGWPVGWSSLAPLGSIEEWLSTHNWAREPDGVPRVCGKVPDRVARIRAIGNGQVPQCVVLAWKLLTK